VTYAALLGKKVVAFRGYGALQYILFEDDLILSFNEQSPYDYHDCCQFAQIIELNKDTELWQKLFNEYPEPPKEILNCPF